MHIDRLIIATKNQGKLAEIKSILSGLDIEILFLKDFNKRIRIVENGVTFYDNALRKALRVSKEFSNDYVVGEDSGLEVEYLNSGPGVYSKRYSGKNASDKKNNNKLLKVLKGVRKAKRSACFRCCLVVVKNKKVIKTLEGKLKGRIAGELKGGGGFGYDPVFYLPSRHKTVAQLSPDIKNKISHRAKAFKKLKKYIQKLQ